jgi:hypothetical protein
MGANGARPHFATRNPAANPTIERKLLLMHDLRSAEPLAPQPGRQARFDARFGAHEGLLSAPDCHAFD